MQKIKCAILNIIVSLLALVALVGFFVFPLWEIKSTIKFNEDLAKLIFKQKEDVDENLENPEDDILTLLIEELVEERISLDFSVAVDTTFIATTALSASKTQTKNFIYSIIDNLVASIDEETLNELEDSIAKASVTAAIKVELNELSKNNDMSVDDVMEEIGVDEEYLDKSATAILDAISAENADVDSVTDEIIDVVKDVYTKYGESSLADESFEDLSPEAEAELRAEIADVIGQFADSEGNFDGGGIISTLINQLLSAEKEEETNGGEEGAAPEQNLAFMVRKYLAPADDSTQSEKPIKEKLADALKAKVNDKVIEGVSLVTTIVFAFILFSSLWWILLLLKILIKLGMRNPLVKLKAPIIFGGLPFLVFFILPTIAVYVLSNPPSFIEGLLSYGFLETLSSLLGDGSIKLSFASSSIFSFACGFVLFVFGFYYASQRRNIKRAIKEERYQSQRRGGLY